MRKIKFRAWDKSSNTYFRECDWLSFKPGGIRFMWTDYASDETMVTDLVDGSYVLMQHTGLKDRDGKEIYEGDIVEIPGPVNFEDSDDWDDATWLNPPLQESEFDVVDLSNFRLWLKNEKFGYEGEDLTTPSDCKIIGNIHQHPELIPEINRN